MPGFDSARMPWVWVVLVLLWTSLAQGMRESQLTELRYATLASQTSLV